MKHIFLLFVSLLCLGVFCPIGGYYLGQGLPSNASATAEHDTTESSTDSTSNPDSTNSADNTSNTTSASGTDSTSNPNANTTASEQTLQSLLDAADAQNTPTTSEDASDEGDDSALGDALAPVLLYEEGSGEVLSVSVRDYLIGATASELAMTWPDEALKAQIVACHSYILYCKENTDTDALGGAYRSVDPARRQGYMTDSILQSYWGTDYAANHARLSALVDEVLDVVVLYEGEVAATSYFAISNTMTESSAEVWGEALPYLISVDSSADANAEGYLQSVTYTEAQVESILFTVFGISTTAYGDDDRYEPSEYFGAVTLTDAGYVAQIEVCGVAISGVTFRSAFSLRSSCFWVYYNGDGTFTITTAGYGHGVGLSQWGAKFMAESGSSYAEILAHYYPNTVLGSAVT